MGPGQLTEEASSAREMVWCALVMIRGVDDWREERGNLVEKFLFLKELSRMVTTVVKFRSDSA